MNIKELFQGKVDMSSQDIIASGKNDVNQIALAFSKLGMDEHQYSKIMTMLASLSVASDGKISPAELAFFREVFDARDLSMDDFIAGVTSTVSVDALSELKSFIENVSLGTKACMLDFCLDICAIDGTIDMAEQALFGLLLDSGD